MQNFLDTLRRLPDDIVLDMATREFRMTEASSCVCGWALQVALDKLIGAPESRPHSLLRDQVPATLALLFGGAQDEWDAMYYGVLPRHALRPEFFTYGDHVADIELAFVERVAEAVEASA